MTTLIFGQFGLTEAKSWRVKNVINLPGYVGSRVL